MKLILAGGSGHLGNLLARSFHGGGDEVVVLSRQPVNLSSPEPLPYAAFMRILRESWGAPWGLPAARWMLAIGAFFLRTEPELVLKSRRVVPARLLQSGFTFLHPAWPEAARDLCARWREDAPRRRARRQPGF